MGFTDASRSEDRAVVALDERLRTLTIGPNDMLVWRLPRDAGSPHRVVKILRDKLRERGLTPLIVTMPDGAALEMLPETVLRRLYAELKVRFDGAPTTARIQ